MDVRGAKVQVMMTGIVMMRMIVVVVMVVLEEERTDEIDQKADGGDTARLIEMNRDWNKEAMDRFARHDERNYGENDGTGKATEDSHLAGAETVARIGTMAAAEVVSQSGDEECHNMGAHVPTVGKQGHGIEDNAGSDLDDHHYGCDCYHDAGAPLGGGKVRRVIM